MYNLKRLELMLLALAKEQKKLVQEQKSFIQEQKSFVQEQKNFLQAQAERDAKYTLERLEQDAKYTKAQVERDEKHNEQIRLINQRIEKVTGTIGAAAEFEFYQAIINNNKICGGISFDEVHPNVKTSREYDIVLVNGDYVGLVEVKWSANISDVNKLIKKQIPDFRKDIKSYQNKKLVAFLGMYVYNQKVANHALQNGIGVLYENGQQLKEEHSTLTIF